MSVAMPADDESERDDEVLDEIRRLREDLEGDDELVSTDPREAYELWTSQLGEKSEETLRDYGYRVTPFLDFLDAEGIDDLSDLTTRHIKKFEAIRRSGDRQKQTLNNQLGTLRQFLRYCEELDAVSTAVVEAVNVPSLTKDDRVNTEKLVTERAHDILDKLDRYRHASRDHVIMLLLWRSILRIGALHGLDLEDIYIDAEDRERLRDQLREKGLTEPVIDEILDDVELPVMYPRHRPETGTPLKNGEAGERVINIADWVADVIEAYIRVNREDLEDEHGRRPLLTSSKGGTRYSTSAIRNTVYFLTQPCEFGDPCPYDEDPDTCQARVHGYGAQCPGSRSPHKIRTGSITWHRDRGWPVPAIADKANTSEELIKGVYDQPEQLVRGAVRREHLDKLDGDQ